MLPRVVSLVLVLFAAGCIQAAEEPVSDPKESTEENGKAEEEKEPPKPQPYAGSDLQVLRAGFCKVDITPDRSAPLVGYGFRSEGNDGVRDPLHARVLAISDSGEPGIIVALDLCVLGGREALRLREDIAEAAQTSVERVMIGAIHTHSGPPASDIYMATIGPKIVDAARRAARLMYPVEVRTHEAPLGLAYNRRVKQADGTVKHCWGPQEWPDRSPENAIDPTCTLVMLQQKTGRRRYLLWNFGAHPVVLGKTSRIVSADYPGNACRLLEEYVPDSHAMFVLGPCGETQPWIATQEDARQVETVARCAASFVAVQTHAAKPAADAEATLQVATKKIKVGRVEDVELSVWRLGGVWVVGLPGEIFQGLTLKLRQELPGPVVIVTLANGTIGYVPTEGAFEEGGYEVNATRWSEMEAGDGERMINETLSLARSLMDEGAQAEAAAGATGE